MMTRLRTHAARVSPDGRRSARARPRRELPIERRRGRLLGLSVLLALLITGGGALASSAADYAIIWSVLASGGGPASSASYAMVGTAGQPAVGTLSGDNYALGSGFWGDTAAPAEPTQHHAYLPVVLRDVP